MRATLVGVAVGTSRQQQTTPDDTDRLSRHTIEQVVELLFERFDPLLLFLDFVDEQDVQRFVVHRFHAAVGVADRQLRKDLGYFLCDQSVLNRLSTIEQQRRAVAGECRSGLRPGEMAPTNQSRAFFARVARLVVE
jgi:hypothetical protein